MSAPPCLRKLALRRSAGAFTLIEIMLVLMILIFMTAMVAPAIARKAGEDQLFDAGRKLESFLREARARAILSGERSVVRFGKEGLTLTVAGPETEDPEARNFDEEDGVARSLRLELPGGVTIAPILPRRSGAAEAGDEAGRHGVIRFTPSGFCEIPPIRLTRGNAWIEKRFSPLTALVDEEAFNIP